MTSQEFRDFAQLTIRELAKMRSAESDRTFAECLPEAEVEFHKIAHEGLATPDHFFYCLKSAEGTSAGWLWYGIREKAGKKRVFIFDIVVEETHRGRGCGKLMLTWLDQKTLDMGLSEITLHVLGTNHVARGLYESMGYAVTNLYMAKKLPV